MTDHSTGKRKKYPRTIYKEELAPHRFLREILRHYLEFRDYVAQGNDHVIEHSYLCYDKSGRVKKVTMEFSFWDLHRGLSDLPLRKREAIFYNILMDKKQEDVAKIMGISTVSAGQYCNLGLKSIVDQFYDGGKAIMTETFLDDYEDDSDA